jgi:hypothetical protein
MSHANRKLGFTMIELMLAMAFVSALLLAIAMTVIQIGNTYNRGITYKGVNRAGSALANELLRGINSGSSFNLASTDPVYYIPQSWGGRLCTGQYSYIWNYGKALESGDTNSLNTYPSPNQSTPINFVKILDSSESYCNLATTTKKEVDMNDAVELLNAGQNNLAIHDFSITSNAYDGKTLQRLYNISFLIGTNDQTTLTDASGSTECLLANDVNSNPTYCAVNKFDILARAGNKAAEAAE